jgi:predicted acetyltransferase
VDNQTRQHPPMLLRPMNISDEKQAKQAHEELAPDDFEFLFVKQGEDWVAYLERVERERLGLDLPEGWVPSTFLVAEVEGQVVGRVSIRHDLNAHLAQVGGHIGYGVRPAFRRRGYATDIMRQSLGVAASVGLDRVLVTCDTDNVGSARVIESCGGVLENVLPGNDGSVGPGTRRYWVETAS